LVTAALRHAQLRPIFRGLQADLATRLGDVALEGAWLDCESADDFLSG